MISGFRHCLATSAPPPNISMAAVIMAENFERNQNVVSVEIFIFG
jgi:hypothetical protein